jgi:tRNA dimethylallyltransferase
MRAALAPLAMSERVDPEHRRALETRLEDEGPEALHAQLKRLDPAAARAIDPRNSRRVLRALETVLATGQGWSGRNDLWEPVYDYPTTVAILILDRNELYARINARAAVIVREGAVEEVRRFRDDVGPARSRPGNPGICSAIGYPEICRYLDGTQTLGETIEQVAAATRRYARRQLTWLSKVRGAVIIDVHDKPPRRTAEEVLASARVVGHTKESL